MVPALLVTGFLGSGKTSLLNRMLARRPPGATGRWAIIVNELGSVGVDGALLPTGMTKQVELASGCICCVLNEELDKTVLDLASSTPDLELLVIETTGVAEPMPIAWSLEAEPVSDQVRLAAVVTLVDAVNHEAHRPVSPAVDAQVEYADILAITKLDLAGLAEPPPELVASLRARNPVAPIISGTGDELADAMWALVADPASRTAARARPEGGHDHASGGTGDHAAEGHGDHGGLHGVSSVALPIEGTLDFEELADALEALPASYVRIKGIARVIDRETGSDEPRTVAFHRVGARVSREILQSAAPGRMVALGHDLDRDRLAACLQAAVLSCETGD